MRRGRGSWVVVLAAVAVIQPLLPAIAPAAEESASGPQLTTGEWDGEGSLNGRAIVERDGLDMNIYVGIDSEFFIDVLPDGTVDGSWEYGGPAWIDARADGDLVLTFDGRVEGLGIVEGTAAQLVSPSEFTVEGVAHIGTFRQNISQSSPLEPLRIRVVEATCNEAFGEWTLPLEFNDIAPGWTHSYEGFWSARRVDATTSDERGELEDIERDMEELSDRVLDEYEDYEEGREVGQMGIHFDGLLDLVREHVDLVNRLRALDDCQDDAAGEDGLSRHFTHLATHLLSLVELAAEFHLNSTQIRQLMNAAKATGALGSGSPAPERAATTEESLRQRAESLFRPHVAWSQDEVVEAGFAECPSIPCIIATPEAIDVLVLGAQNGWQYDIGNDVTLDAADAVAGSIETAEPSSP